MVEYLRSMEWRLFKVKKDWKYILRKAWSVKIVVVAGVLTGAQFLFLMAWEQGLVSFRPWWYPSIMGSLMAATLIARILAQKEL